jgi:ubiquinone/menaquinone biosynthesis C-methylase UbiE
VLPRWLVQRLDRVLYRHPFEGRSARRYRERERPAFKDLDERLLDGLADRLGSARVLADVGAGPGTFAAAAAARHGHLTVLAIDPSRDFAVARAGVHVLRACGEQLPIDGGCVDAAMCLSSIRHVRDRTATLRELRRIVRRDGVLVIVELDPDASERAIALHADALGSPILRRTFGPLVCRTAPPARAIIELAAESGWRVRAQRKDDAQPVYILELQ